ncbi:4'-phosphopantetheinyl transferase family protein [Saccharothrix xinjiangensis]|uniref:4'-phosphopantetheinyl transferase family protein n=1 Tax=Saccharothrix xinjiangensis TaxID=204798 RepID=A0ABV9Y740_9PSEU
MRCEVWWARPVDGLTGLLDADERARLARFRDRGALLRHVTGRALARVLLGRELGASPAGVRLTASCERCGCANGKPRLAEPRGVHFSVSHSGDRVVVALSRGADVGVDVEETGPVDPRAAELAGCPAGAGFHLAWARKEAVLKATGHGLSVPPAAVRLSPPDEPPRLLGWSGPEPLGTPVALHDLDAGPGYAASVALLTGGAWAVEQFDAVPLLAGHGATAG